MKRIKQIFSLALCCILALSLFGCVDQHPDTTGGESSSAAGVPDGDGSGSDSAAGEAEQRIVCTSSSLLEICDMLEIDLVGVPTLDDIPERYADLTQVGTPMSPDLEIVASLEPTDVLASESIADSLREQADAASIPLTGLDVSSVEALYATITYLGEKYGREELAAQYVQEYEEFLAEYNSKIQGQESPTVLVLMGLPSTYIEATPDSYVGALVTMAGGTVVVDDDSSESFLSWNTEELYQLDPDYILLTAHGLPDEAMEMFAEEFTTNTIWQNFRAVQNGHVYQLDYEVFSMTANFDWMEGLNSLYEIFYEGTAESYQP